MSIVTSVGNFFRAASPDKSANIDKYDILSPLMSVQEYAERTKELLTLMEQDDKVKSVLNSTPSDSKNKVVSQAIEAEQDFVKNLPFQFHRKAASNSFSIMIFGLTSIMKNLAQIENHFPTLFGTTTGELDEENLRSSSLVIIGYIETVSEFCTWVGTLIRHLTATDHDLIPPFETKSLTLKAARFGSFIGFNLTQWDGDNDGILSTVKTMQKKGVDVTIKSGDNWIDSFVHDNQFSPIEQDLMGASLRNPIMMIASAVSRIKAYQLELMSTRKDWLIAKIALESERLRGMDPNSAEYKRLDRATEKYANLVSKYEQKIERARA